MLNKNYWVDYIIDMKKDLCWESCMIRFDSILFASKGWWQLTTNLVLLFFGFLKFSGFTFESIQYYFPITLLRFSFNLVVLNTIRKWNHNSCRASGDSIDFFFSFFFFFFFANSQCNDSQKIRHGFACLRYSFQYSLRVFIPCELYSYSSTDSYTGLI